MIPEPSDFYYLLTEVRDVLVAVDAKLESLAAKLDEQAGVNEQSQLLDRAADKLEDAVQTNQKEIGK